MRLKAVLVALASTVIAGGAAAQEPRWQAGVLGIAHEYQGSSGWGLLLGRGPDTGARWELLLESRRWETRCTTASSSRR